MDEVAIPHARVLLWQAREALLNNPAWLDYARQIYSIDPGGFPFLTYVGLNFTDRTIKNFKFYYSFSRRLSEAELSVVLPVTDRGQFDEFYEQWHPSPHYKAIHRGTTFAVKVDAEGALTHYYHMRIKGLPFGPPQRLELGASDHDNYHGVCEEFSGGDANLKRYFYCAEPSTIAASLKTAGLHSSGGAVPKIELLEYIESEHRDKLTWISSDRGLLDALMDNRGPPALRNQLGALCRKCGFNLFAPGSARDGGDHSVYFVLPSDQGGAGGGLFDGVRRFCDRYLDIEV